MNETHNTCFYLNVNLEKTEEVFITNILTCIFNSMFSFLTCAGNFIILLAIRKHQDLHSPSVILLCGLAFSDLIVGAICQPCLVALKIAELLDNFPSYCMLRIIQNLSGYITSGASLFTLAAVSFERLLAVTLHLRYSVIATIPRVLQTAFSLWIFSTAVVILKSWMKTADWDVLPLAILSLTLFVTAFSTFKIFHIVRRHRRQINDQNMAALNVQTNTVNVLKCKKSAVTVLYIYGLLLIFYLPFGVTMLVEAFIGYTRSVKIAYDYATTAVFINSFLDPLVYCWRIRDIRRAVKNVLRRQ